MNSIEHIAANFEQVSILIADAIIARTNPVKDDMSENEAQEAYGTRWLNTMRDKGLATFSRIGNKKIYSRHQLDCLRAAEREQARLVFKKVGKEII